MTASRNDRLAVAGMAAVAFTASVLLHEGLGHGGTCLIAGGKPVAWGAYYFDCAAPTLAGERLVSAAGALVNLIAAVAAFAGLRAAKTTGARLFVWLFAALNAFQFAGYFAFSGIAGIGDWGPDGVLKGVTHAGVWRIVEAIGGAALYAFAGGLAAQVLSPILGGSPDRIRTARALCWTAYFTGGGLAVLIGLLNPVGLFIVLASAAASTFGGASGLLWLPSVMPRDGGEPPLDPLPMRPWLIAGAVVAAAYAAALGRGWTA